MDPFGLGAVNSGSFLGSLWNRVENGFIGAGSGAVTGAGTGALVGAGVGVWGAGVGAAPGAVAGASAGAIAGGIGGFIGGVLADPHASVRSVAVGGAINGVIGGATAGAGAAFAAGSRAAAAASEAVVAAKGASPLRQAYIAEVNELKGLAASARAAGQDAEATARMLSAERRAIGVTYKDLTPADELARITARNIRDYGDPLGPTVDWLRAQGKSWEQIIESASRSGGKNLGY